MPDWVKEGGPVVMVALGAIWMFLQAFNKWGVSRDEERAKIEEMRDREREAFLLALKEQTDASISAILALVGLATRMVDGCQAHVPITQRVTTSNVIEAAEQPRS